MTVALLVFLGFWLLALAFSAWRLASRRNGTSIAFLPSPLPRVSILIAARNEEAALPRCLTSLRRLSYSAELLEVLVGDDASADRTATVATATMRGFAGTFRVVPIAENLGQARGKANVLAHLAHEATTDYFFITDADIELPTSWITALLVQATPNVGTVTGITAVRGPRLFHQLQGLDWLLSLGLIQVVSNSGRPVTAMGNNMLVTRAAYEATGGYAKLPFSVTEDYALFWAVLAQGYSFRHVFSAAARADSLPMPTWRALLKQRRRWLRGVAALPLRLRLELLVFSAFWPALAALAWLAGPVVALGGWGLKVLVQGVLVAVAYHRAGLRLRYWLLPVFELYTLALTVSMVAIGLLGGSVEWKGRRYD